VARSASSQLAVKHIAELLIKHGARSGDADQSLPGSRASGAHDDVRIPPEDRGTQNGHSSCHGKRMIAHMNVGLCGPSSIDFVVGLLVLWAVSVSYVYFVSCLPYLSAAEQSSFSLLPADRSLLNLLDFLALFQRALTKM